MRLRARLRGTMRGVPWGLCLTPRIMLITVTLLIMSTKLSCMHRLLRGVATGFITRRVNQRWWAAGGNATKGCHIGGHTGSSSSAISLGS